MPAELKASRKGTDARDVGPQQADLRLRLRHRRADRQGQGLVLRLVLAAGRAAGAPRRRARRSHAAEEPGREAELAGDPKDMVSFLYFDGFKIKDGRSPGTSGITVRRADRDVPPGQRVHRQPAARTVEDRRRPHVRLEHVPVGEVRVLQHRVPIRRIGGMDAQAGQEPRAGASYGSTRQSLNVRPQKILNIDANSFLSAMGMSHDVKYGFSFRSDRRQPARCGRAT